MVGFVIAIAVGVFLGSVLISFWDEIKMWLNGVAADCVEKHLGYNARTKMHKAISKVDKLVGKVRNVSTIYSKRNELDTYYDKTTVISEVEEYEIDKEVIQKINEENELIQEFEYRQ